jgi:hypothetical protein
VSEYGILRSKQLGQLARVLVMWSFGEVGNSGVYNLLGCNAVCVGSNEKGN